METASTLSSPEQIITAASRLSLPELKQVFEHLLTLQAARKAPHLSAVESVLFARINQGTPASLRERTAQLKAKHEDETITDAEYEELTLVSDKLQFVGGLPKGHCREPATN